MAHGRAMSVSVGACVCVRACVSHLVNAAQQGLGGLVLVWGAACLNGPQQGLGGQGHDPVQQTQQQGHYQLPTHIVSRTKTNTPAQKTIYTTVQKIWVT